MVLRTIVRERHARNRAGDAGDVVSRPAWILRLRAG